MQIEEDIDPALMLPTIFWERQANEKIFSSLKRAPKRDQHIGLYIRTTNGYMSDLSAVPFPWLSGRTTPSKVCWYLRIEDMLDEDKWFAWLKHRAWLENGQE